MDTPCNVFKKCMKYELWNDDNSGAKEAAVWGAALWKATAGGAALWKATAGGAAFALKPAASASTWCAISYVALYTRDFD